MTASASFWNELWYGTGRRFGHRLAKGPLWAASAAFGAAVAVRNRLYDSGALRSIRIEGLSVVSVGNLNVGGAGKTPAVIHLANAAAAEGRKVAVLSRGYGRASDVEWVFRGEGPTADEAGDEPVLIARRCPSAHVLVGPDRARLAARAKEELGADLVFLDDGMQHRRLARDAEVVVVDEAAGFGNGRLLPAGPLREPLSALERASLVWLKASDAPVPLPSFPAPVVRARYVPAALVSPEGSLESPTALAGQDVIALAAIARPDGFARTVESLSMRVAHRRFFRDHHRFVARELDEVRALKLPIVTTEKDAARLPRGFPAWVVRLEVEILSGAEAIRSLWS